MRRLVEFFEGAGNRLSMTRLLCFLSFFPASYVVILDHEADTLGWYIGGYVLGYIGGKIGDKVGSEPGSDLSPIPSGGSGPGIDTANSAGNGVARKIKTGGHRRKRPF